MKILSGSWVRPQKCMKKWQKSDNAKNQIVLKIKVCIFWTGREMNRQRASVLGRFTTVIDYMVKKKHFLFQKQYRNFNSFRDIALFLFPMWLWDEALDCGSFCFATRCSQRYKHKTNLLLSDSWNSDLILLKNSTHFFVNNFL